MIDLLSRRVLAYCRTWNMLPQGGTVLCAVSGGRDSMALLHLLSALAGEAGFQVAAAHFNHHLRPGADRDEAFVRDWCRGRGIPLLCGGEDVGAFARREGLGVEEAARKLRYRFLEAAADQASADRIATAHHRQDNAETVLLHLLRGSGAQGLCGIPPVRGRIVRPLLETGREEIDAYVLRRAIPYVEDETNLDAAYTRNRLRLEVMPLLEDIFPGCSGRVAAAGALLREEDDHLRREAAALAPEAREDEISIPASLLDSQDLALRRRIVRTMGARLGASLSRAHVDAALALRRGGCRDLPGGLLAVRRADCLLLRRAASLPPPMALRPGEQVWGPWRVLVREAAGGEEAGADTLLLRAGTLTIAPWDGTGRLAVKNGSRTIKRLFADRGIPVERRREYPVVYRDGAPAAVFGVAVDRGCRPREGERCTAVSLLWSGEK